MSSGQAPLSPPRVGPASPPRADHRITLKILSPGNGVPESIEIRDVPLSISVGALKERIALVAHSHPPATSQRLIFGGRVLADNSASLMDALGPETVRAQIRAANILTLHLIVRPNGGAALHSHSQPHSRAGTPVQNIPAGAASMSTNAPASAVNGTPGSGQAHHGQQGLPVQQEQQGPHNPINRFPNFPQQPALHGMPFLHMPLQAQHAFQAAHGQQAPATAPADGSSDPHSTPSNPNGAAQAPDSRPPAPDPMQQHNAIHEAAVRQALGGQIQQPRVVGMHAQWRAAPFNFGPLGQLGGQPMPPGFPAPFALPQNIAQPLNNQQQPAAAATATSATQIRTTSGQGQGQSQGAQPQRGPTPVAGNLNGLPIMPLPPHMPLVPSMAHSTLAGLTNSLGHIRAQEQLMNVPSNIYLLSSPAGPQAIVYHQNGVYHAQLPFQPGLTGSPLNAIPAYISQHNQGEADRQQGNQAAIPANLQGGQPIQPAAVAQQHQGANVADGNNAIAGAPAPAEPPGLLQPLLQHFWMLIRILIFAYFFIGTDDGWRRPAILVAIGIAFFVLRGFDAGRGFRDGLRRWWDGVVGLPQRQAGNGNQAQGQRQPPGQGQAGQVNIARGPEGHQQHNVQQAPAPVVAPQQAARQNDNDMSPLRQRLRPIERAIALFIASLWPGVGENTVRQHREAEAQLRREEAEALAAAASATAAIADSASEGRTDGEPAQAGSASDAGPANGDGEHNTESASAMTSGAVPDDGAARERKTFTHDEQGASGLRSGEGSSASTRPPTHEG